MIRQEITKLTRESTCTLDNGHRVGNFHNYYEFNPADNRLSILENCGFLEFITDAKNSLTLENMDDSDTCDIDNRASKRQKRDEGSMLYCDLGCNEGDLTLALASAISKSRVASDKDKSISVNCLGLDIDQELIDRANSKREGRFRNYTINEKISREHKDIERTGSDSNDSNEDMEVEAEFVTCNLIDDKDHSTKSKAFLDKFGKARFHLTSIFSTTMWIHIHGGDSGLIDFLQRAAEMTEYLLLEPQPSKCYRNVNVRLRRMNRPELDVSTERLKMRFSVETEVEQVLKKCGFERVFLSPTASNGQSEDQDCKALDEKASRTKWNRNLQLYKRC